MSYFIMCVGWDIDPFSPTSINKKINLKNRHKSVLENLTKEFVMIFSSLYKILYTYLNSEGVLYDISTAFSRESILQVFTKK